MNYKPGDHITVRVGGKDYDTWIDEAGVQRFIPNRVICHLFDTHRLDLNQLAVDYHQGKFDKRSYAEFNMQLGYSVGGFRELSAFEDWEIDNPVWKERE